MTVRHLERLFQAQSVALIGASQKQGSVGEILTRNILAGGFKGRAYPVNPRHFAILGRPCFPDVEALPEAPDLGVVATPPEAVPGIVQALGRRGCKAAVVITGAARVEAKTRRALRQAVTDAARPFSMRVIGPNSIGIIVPQFGLNASFAHLTPLPGDVAFLAQSGVVAGAILDWAAPRQIGFSHLVSLCEMADVDYPDMLDYLAADSGTRASLLSVEALADARKFLSAARAASRAKPVIVLRTGVQRGGPARDAVFDAAFRRSGMLRVHTLEELFDAVEAVALRAPRDARPGRGERIVVLSNGRGIGMLATDVLAGQGARLARIEAETCRRLDEALPCQWFGSNPVDILPDADGPRYARAMEILLDDREVDALLVVHSPVGSTDPEDAANCVAEAVERARAEGAFLPWIFASWIGVQTGIPARRLLERHRIPTFQTPGAAIRAFQYLVRHRAVLNALMETPASIPEEFETDPAEVRAVLDRALGEGRDMLSEPEARVVLRAYRMPLDGNAEGTLQLFAAAEVDPTFGPIIRLGLGGAAGALVTRTVVGFPPLNHTLARDLIAQLSDEGRSLADRASVLPFDEEALALALVQLSHLVGDFAEMRIVRLDPLFAGPDGVHVAAVSIGIGAASGSAAARLVIPPYPKELESSVLLPDGGEGVLRPIRPEDEPELHVLSRRMSPKDIRLRFFQPLRELGHDLAARLTQIDYDRHMAFVLTRPGVPGQAEILGVVRLIREPTGTSGEYAVTVRSDLGGQGIGRLLMDRIIAYGRSIGLQEIFGVVLAENRAMLALCQALGFRTDPEPDEPSLVRVTLPLTRPECAPPTHEAAGTSSSSSLDLGP